MLSVLIMCLNAYFIYVCILIQMFFLLHGTYKIINRFYLEF